MKGINASIIKPLKDTLSSLFWKKSDLKSFLYFCFKKETSTIISTLDFNQYKINIVNDLIDRMVKRQDIYQEDLINLINQVCEFNDFSHFINESNRDELIKKAKDNLTHFRIVAKPMLDNYLCEAKTSKDIVISNTINIKKLDEMKEIYYKISSIDNPQTRGYELEKFLNQLFSCFDISNKGPFKVNGEQIDGAFTLDGNEFLIEAKWQKSLISKSDIYSFSGKVRNKLKNTLGLFVSVNGYSFDKANSTDFPDIILCDSIDIIGVLESRFSLDELIRRKKQEASRTGNVYYHL
ncbi:MAG: hypothetical protein IJR67_01855 [Acholeplasmatales bacterium]|nr:hypothetical protein [Acholeplasmatales bacterium]